jgi:hypothetical protein
MSVAPVGAARRACRSVACLSDPQPAPQARYCGPPTALRTVEGHHERNATRSIHQQMCIAQVAHLGDPLCCAYRTAPARCRRQVILNPIAKPRSAPGRLVLGRRGVADHGSQHVDAADLDGLAGRVTESSRVGASATANGHSWSIRCRNGNPQVGGGVGAFCKSVAQATQVRILDLPPDR